MNLSQISLVVFLAISCPAISHAQHRLALQGAGKLAIVDREGKIEWQMPWRGIHDLHVLKNGNLVVQDGAAKVAEIDVKKKEVVWSYDSAKANGNEGKRIEVHGFQPLDDGKLMIAESGAQRIIEIDRDGKLLKEIKLQVDHPNAHTDALETPGKYSLLELMIVVTLLAVVLGLIRLLGIWGAVLTFVGSVAWTTYIYPNLQPANRSRQAAMFDGAWGLVMPLVCLACDPFVFKDQQQLVDFTFEFENLWQRAPQFHRESLSVYAFVGWQMVWLCIWILVRPWLSRWAGFFLGTWAIGIMFAGVLAALLAIPAMIGAMMGIGLLGFTPVFTSYTLGRRMREAVDAGIHLGSDQSVAVYWLLAAFGFMAAILVPMQIATMWKLPIAP